jgi:hypothetical protein
MSGRNAFSPHELISCSAVILGIGSYGISNRKGYANFVSWLPNIDMFRLRTGREGLTQRMTVSISLAFQVLPVFQLGPWMDTDSFVAPNIQRIWSLVICSNLQSQSSEMPIN